MSNTVHVNDKTLFLLQRACPQIAQCHHEGMRDLYRARYARSRIMITCITITPRILKQFIHPTKEYLRTSAIGDFSSLMEHAGEIDMIEDLFFLSSTEDQRLQEEEEEEIDLNSPLSCIDEVMVDGVVIPILSGDNEIPQYFLSSPQILQEQHQSYLDRWNEYKNTKEKMGHFTVNTTNFLPPPQILQEQYQSYLDGWNEYENTKEKVGYFTVNTTNSLPPNKRKYFDATKEEKEKKTLKNNTNYLPPPSMTTAVHPPTHFYLTKKKKSNGELMSARDLPTDENEKWSSQCTPEIHGSVSEQNMLFKERMRKPRNCYPMQGESRCSEEGKEGTTSDPLEEDPITNEVIWWLDEVLDDRVATSGEKEYFITYTNWPYSVSNF